MKFNINIKKTLLVCIDAVIGCYLFMAFTSWHKPADISQQCTKVVINIADDKVNGFLNSDDVKALLVKKGTYPISKSITDINPRRIEDQLVGMPFVKTAQCYITTEGHVFISLTQNIPVARVKSSKGEDYYVDANGGVMPNSQYTSDMVIVTGDVSRTYANRYIAPLADAIMADDLWRNQVEQINILGDLSVELVPRVGDHIINIGPLPLASDDAKRKERIKEYVDKQLKRLELFYRYGLSHAGWNKYDYISLEYTNQIVCRKRE